MFSTDVLHAACRLGRPARAALAVIGLCSAVAALAADPLTEAIDRAYAPYRSALFKTNAAPVAEAQQAVAQAAQAWTQLRQQFAVASPPYAQTAWARTAETVSATYAEAQRQAEAGQVKAAHDTLERVRDALAGLRQAHGVVVFSDHMNAYHEAMEHLLESRPAPGATADFLALMAPVGVMEHLAGRLATQAPPALAAQPEFQARRQAVADSVAALKRAVLAQDAAATTAALKALKPAYSRLFVAFG